MSSRIPRSNENDYSGDIISERQQFLEEKTGYGIVINASLNRPGEALACSPEDAVEMFIGSELEYMIMEDILVTKRQESETW